MRLPVIDIHTVGAGGGSIAYVDAGGALRVGPRSAGADPGPACYGTGTELTVTDANLLLGRLDPELVPRRANGARHLAGRAPPRRVSRAVEAGRRRRWPKASIRVANANMERAIRVVSVERGHDPRRFALAGVRRRRRHARLRDRRAAGNRHGRRAATRRRALGARHAGRRCHEGLLGKRASRPAMNCRGRISRAGLRRWSRAARDDLTAEGFAPKRQRLERLLDVRYVGQSYEITVPLETDYRAEFDAASRPPLRLLESTRADRSRGGARARERAHREAGVAAFARDALEAAAGGRARRPFRRPST